MKRITLLLLVALTTSQPVVAQVNPVAPKEAVTIEINADLLRRAREKNIDLSFIMEKQIEAVLGPLAGATSSTQASVSKAPVSHETLIAAAFDSFEAMVFAPLRIDRNTSVEMVRTVCQSVLDDLDQLVAYAETRKSMALPTTIEEAKALDQYLAGRFQAFQARMGKDGNKANASGKILEANCPDLDVDESIAQEAMATALDNYGPKGWCQATMRKPQSQWTMEDGGNFAKYCQGVTLN